MVVAGVVGDGVAEEGEPGGHLGAEGGPDGLGLGAEAVELVEASEPVLDLCDDVALHEFDVPLAEADGLDAAHGALVVGDADGGGAEGGGGDEGVEAVGDDEVGGADEGEVLGDVVGVEVLGSAEAGGEGEVAVVVAEESDSAVGAQEADEVADLLADARLDGEGDVHQLRVADAQEDASGVGGRGGGEPPGDLSEGDGRAAAEAGPEAAEGSDVLERGAVAEEGDVGLLVEGGDLAVGHDVGAVDELAGAVIDASSGEAHEHEGGLEGGEGVEVEVELSVLEEVPSADDDAVAVEVHLVDHGRGEPGAAVGLEAAGGGDGDDVDDASEGFADEMAEGEVDGVVADVEAVGMDAEEGRHAGAPVWCARRSCA